MKTKDVTLPTDVLPKATAIQYATDWQADHTVKGFVVPLNDFQKVIDEADADTARVYIGLDGSGTEKLMIVGVDSAGSDLIDYDNGLYIYDFTTPCPAMCDEDSPLYIDESK